MPLAEQDRTRWDTAMIAEGVDVLQSALALERVGEYQAQAAIAALHCDAQSAEETDWTQVLEWYDELLGLTGSKVVALNRVVAVGEADGPLAGLKALADVPDDVPRRTAVEAWLRERGRRDARSPTTSTPGPRPRPATWPSATTWCSQAARLSRN